MARSRQPIGVARLGALRRAVASAGVSQFPALTPSRRAPRILAMPRASSGASQPLSAASAANLRTALSRTLIEEAESPARVARYRCTVALFSPEAPAERYHSRKRVRARS